MKRDLDPKDLERLIKNHSGYIDRKMAKAINALKANKTQDLKKKLSNLDLDEVSQKMNDIDKEKIKSSLDLDKLKRKLTQQDFAKMEKMLGKKGPEIIKKVKNILYD